MQPECSVPVIAAHFTRVWSQQSTSYTHDPPMYMSYD
jgi:hypothetical protein